MTDNLKLWNQVCETDPTHTKKVAYGKFKFTAIDAQYQIKRATELWGPYGTDWGLKDCVYSVIREVQLFEKDYKTKETIESIRSEIVLDAVFFYPDGNFDISSDMIYVAGGECRKKLLTDVTTKALSKLGFNSDVFEGKFDDNKYVQTMLAKHAKKEKPKPDPTVMTEIQRQEIINRGLDIGESITQKDVVESIGWYTKKKKLAKGSIEIYQHCMEEPGIEIIVSDYIESLGREGMLGD